MKPKARVIAKPEAGGKYQNLRQGRIGKPESKVNKDTRFKSKQRNLRQR
jgi:hypothetical protein